MLLPRLTRSLLILGVIIVLTGPADCGMRARKESPTDEKKRPDKASDKRPRNDLEKGLETLRRDLGRIIKQGWMEVPDGVKLIKDLKYIMDYSDSRTTAEAALNTSQGLSNGNLRGSVTTYMIGALAKAPGNSTNAMKQWMKQTQSELKAIGNKGSGSALSQLKGLFTDYNVAVNKISHIANDLAVMVGNASLPEKVRATGDAIKTIGDMAGANSTKGKTVSKVGDAISAIGGKPVDEQKNDTANEGTKKDAEPKQSGNGLGDVISGLGNLFKKKKPKGESKNDGKQVENAKNENQAENAKAKNGNQAENVNAKNGNQAENPNAKTGNQVENANARNGNQAENVNAKNGNQAEKSNNQKQTDSGNGKDQKQPVNEEQNNISPTSPAPETTTKKSGWKKAKDVFNLFG